MVTGTIAFDIQVAAMCRSGHHGVIAWLLAKFELTHRVAHLNNCKPGHLAESFAQPYRETGQAKSKIACVVHSYEDQPIEAMFGADVALEREAAVGPAGKRINLLVVRDAFNQFASRLRYGFSGGIRRERTDGQALGDAVALWKRYAEMANPIGDENDGLVPVLFNRWAADPDYLLTLSEYLGLPSIDSGRDVLGTESSFAVDAAIGSRGASDMAVNERWRQLAGEDWYRSIFQDEELVRMSEELFGHIEGTETLIGERQNDG